MHFFDSIKSILIISLIAPQFLIPTLHANSRGVDQHINFNQSLQEVNYEVILCFWKLVLIPSPTIYSRPAKRAADLHDHRTHLPLTVTSAGDCNLGNHPITDYISTLRRRWSLHFGISARAAQKEKSCKMHRLSLTGVAQVRFAGEPCFNTYHLPTIK